jgi:hypothetical protein
MLDGPLAAMSLEDLRAKLAKKTDVFQASEEFPKRWKSLRSGATILIRRDGDRVYVEAVLPDAQRQAGCFRVADLRKQGDSYSGTSTVGCVCANAFGVITNRYTLDDPLEITSLTPTRIEGWTVVPPRGAKLDCVKGTYSKPSVRAPITWIPE